MLQYAKNEFAPPNEVLSNKYCKRSWELLRYIFWNSFEMNFQVVSNLYQGLTSYCVNQQNHLSSYLILSHFNFFFYTSYLWKLKLKLSSPLCNVPSPYISDDYVMLYPCAFCIIMLCSVPVHSTSICNVPSLYIPHHYVMFRRWTFHIIM